MDGGNGNHRSGMDGAAPGAPGAGDPNTYGHAQPGPGYAGYGAAPGPVDPLAGLSALKALGHAALALFHFGGTSEEAEEEEDSDDRGGRGGFRSRFAGAGRDDNSGGTCCVARRKGAKVSVVRRKRR